jgi:hypothetical protein
MQAPTASIRVQVVQAAAARRRIHWHAKCTVVWEGGRLPCHDHGFDGAEFGRFVQFLRPKVLDENGSYHNPSHPCACGMRSCANAYSWHILTYRVSCFSCVRVFPRLSHLLQVLLIADQMISRIEYVHNKNFIHRYSLARNSISYPVHVCVCILCRRVFLLSLFSTCRALA